MNHSWPRRSEFCSPVRPAVRRHRQQQGELKNRSVQSEERIFEALAPSGPRTIRSSAAIVGRPRCERTARNKGNWATDVAVAKSDAYRWTTAVRSTARNKGNWTTDRCKAKSESSRPSHRRGLERFARAPLSLNSDMNAEAGAADDDLVAFEELDLVRSDANEDAGA